MTDHSIPNRILDDLRQRHTIAELDAFTGLYGDQVKTLDKDKHLAVRAIQIRNLWTLKRRFADG